MGEPFIRAGNVTSALVAVGAHVAGYPRIALMLVALDVLDVVGRQVSPQYAAFVRDQSGPAKHVAGLGLAGNLLGFDPPGVRRWEYKGPGVPWVRALRGR